MQPGGLWSPLLTCRGSPGISVSPLSCGREWVGAYTAVEHSQGHSSSKMGLSEAIKLGAAIREMS